jgi:hypothetical protein
VRLLVIAAVGPTGIISVVAASLIVVGVAIVRHGMYYLAVTVVVAVDLTRRQDDHDLTQLLRDYFYCYC